MKKADSLNACTATEISCTPPTLFSGKYMGIPTEIEIIY